MLTSFNKIFKMPRLPFRIPTFLLCNFPSSDVNTENTTIIYLT